MIDLYHALDHEDEALAVSAYETWGFKKLIARDDRGAEPLGAFRLCAAAGRPQAPHPGARLLGLWPRRGRDRAPATSGGSGGVKPPREFVFMDRAAVGLGSVFLHLKAEINWHDLFHELIDDFDEKKLARRPPETGAQIGRGRSEGLVS